MIYNKAIIAFIHITMELLENMDDDMKQSKLAALFNALKEDDKDIVIAVTESLIEKYSHTTAAGSIAGEQCVPANPAIIP